MNTVTIIFLTSFVTFVQIAYGLPMFEVTAHRQPIKDNTPDLVNDSPNVTTESPEPLSEKPACKLDNEKEVENGTASKLEEVENDKADRTEDNNKNGKDDDDCGPDAGNQKKEDEEKDGKYQRMNNFVRYAIREHLGHDCDSMSESTEQELYDLFCDMEIIHA